MSDRPDQTFEDKMAIPEGGGEDTMDVSCSEECEGGGYVSIKSKGPGRPITIRQEVAKLQHLSDGIRANIERPEIHGYDLTVVRQFKAEKLRGQEITADSFKGEFLDTRTGHAESLEITKPASASDEYSSTGQYFEDNDYRWQQEVSKNPYAEDKLAEENEQANTCSEFRSHTNVVSLNWHVSESQAHTYMSESPAKRKYKIHQEESKKTIGSKKKSGQGKANGGLRLFERGQPYPKWTDIQLNAILRGSRFVNIGGKLHRIDLVPVDDLTCDLGSIPVGIDRREPGRGPTGSLNIHADGSIDRPPDTSLQLENDHEQQTFVCLPTDTTGLESFSSNDYKASNVVYGSDYSQTVTESEPVPSFYTSEDEPLDLTVPKPLDLSLKGRRDETLQGPRAIESGFEPADNTSSATAHAECNVTDNCARCSSVLSMDDRDSVIGEVLPDSSPHKQEECDDCHGNLPSISRLTLESNDQPQAVAVPKSGVQDSAVQQEMSKVNSGEQYFPNLLASNLVTFLQLIDRYCKNQQKKLAEKQKRPTGTNHSSQTNQQAVLPEAVNTQTVVEEIPAPAIPNLQSLELADPDGGMLEKEGERLKSLLRGKILNKDVK